MDQEFIDKEHPKNRPMESEDPMVLNGTGVPGNAWVMLDSIVEEYARMGWGFEEIIELFRSPFYQATHDLLVRFGEKAVESRIRETLSRCGVQRTKVTLAPPEFPVKLTVADRDRTPDGSNVPRQPKEPNDA